MWGRNHNIGFHVVYVVGAIVSVFAIVWDFWGITKGASVIGLIGGAIIAVPTAFRMKEKSMWYFESCNQIDAILSRLGAGTLDHGRAVEENIRLEKAMTDVWRAVTKSIDIRPIVEIAKRKNC
jgi:hypothetical protein